MKNIIKKYWYVVIGIPVLIVLVVVGGCGGPRTGVGNGISCVVA